MPRSFDPLREQLLRAGIAPRHASRYVTELREHLADLTEAQRASGMDAGQAADRAMALLGSDAQLAQAMLDKGPTRSLAARAPWAVFVMSPLLLFALVTGITVFSMLHLLWPLRALSVFEMPESYRELIEIMSFVSNYLVGALLVTGCIVVATRQRMASGRVWVGVGLIAVLSAFIGVHVHITPPESSYRGGSVFSLVGMVYSHGRPDFVATIAAAALHAAVLFAIAAAASRALRMRFKPVHT